MNLRKEQSKKYLEEAEQTLQAAEFLFNVVKDGKRNLSAQVVKLDYDSMEQAVSAAIAFKDEIIPRNHPQKISSFERLYPLHKDTFTILLKWLRKRSATQYADIKSGRVTIPSESFNVGDAESVLSDSKKVLEDINNIVSTNTA